MRKKKKCRINKLSSAMVGASLDVTGERLNTLQCFNDEARKIRNDIQGLIQVMRKGTAPEGQPFIFTNKLPINEALLRSVFQQCWDVGFRKFTSAGRNCLLVYISGMIDEAALERSTLKILMRSKLALTSIADIVDKQITAIGASVATNPAKVIHAVLSGQILLMVDGFSECILLNMQKYVKRSIEDAKAESVIRGPHDAFNETIVDNIVLFRRKTRDSQVKVEMMYLGERTKTSIALIYAANLTKPGVVEEVRRRLQAIRIDKILLSANIEELIVDHPWSPFPQVQSTERPDKAIAALYEGRVVIVVDNTPYVLIVPCTFNQLMQTTDEYTTQPLAASLIRITRYVSAFLAIYLPAIYVGIASYNPGMLPTSLAMTIAELRATAPFPAFLEAAIMEALLEIFQEAIIRLPEKIAGAAGVVGALVIGTTVVQAGIVNPLLVVIMAASGLSSYSMASYNFSTALRLTRLLMLFLSAILGLYGVAIGLMFVTIHLTSLTSFGESYLGGLLNITLLEDWKDQLVRFPVRLMRTRSKEFGVKNRTRLGNDNG